MERPGDIDVYRVTLDAPAQIELQLANLPADYDLYLSDARGAVIGQSAHEDTATEQLQITVQAGRYYVFVLVDPSRQIEPSLPYTLAFTAAAPSPSTAVTVPSRSADVTVWDPLQDFVPIQGNRGWYYQAYKVSSRTYTQLPMYGQPSGHVWGTDPVYVCNTNPCFRSWNSDTIPWVEVGTRPIETSDPASEWAIQLHPGSIRSEYFDATLSWRSPQAGNVDIAGDVIRNSPCGNGVSLLIVKNDDIVVKHDILELGRRVRVPFSLHFAIAEDDWIHFRLSARDDGNCDATQIRPVITLYPR